MTSPFLVPIALPGDAGAALHAVPRQQLDTQIATRAPLAHNHNAVELTTGVLDTARMPSVSNLVRAGQVTTSLTSDAAAGTGNLINLRILGNATINALTNPSDHQEIRHHLVAEGADRTVTFSGGYVPATGVTLGPHTIPRGKVLVARSEYIGNRTDAADLALPAWALIEVRVTDDTTVGHVHDYILSTARNTPNGVAPVDGNTNVPTANLYLATATQTGIIRLTNDLGGTSSLPTVPGLTNKADVSHTHNPAAVPVAPRTMSATTTASVDGTVAGDMQITATGDTVITPTGTPNGRMMIVEVLASGAQRIPSVATTVALSTGITTRSLTVPINMVGIFGLRYSALAASWMLISAAVETP